MKGIMFNEHFGLESAVLSGRKTMTRRVIKVPTCCEFAGWLTENVKDGEYYNTARFEINDGNPIYRKAPYKIGEVVAIKQSYKTIMGQKRYGEVWAVGNDIEPTTAGYSNKMFVKNKLMLYQTKITNIKVERLQDISERDCVAEGIFTNTYPCDGGMKTVYGCDGFLNHVKGKPIGWFAKRWYSSAIDAFESLIDKVSGKGTWEYNPYVWVIEFELLKTT